MFELEFLKFKYPPNLTPRKKREHEHNLAYSLLDKMLKNIVRPASRAASAPATISMR